MIGLAWQRTDNGNGNEKYDKKGNAPNGRLYVCRPPDLRNAVLIACPEIEGKLKEKPVNKKWKEAAYQ